MKIAAIVRLTDGAGGGSDDLVHAVRLREPLEFRERLHGQADGLGGQDVPGQAPGAETNHVALAIDDLK